MAKKKCYHCTEWLDDDERKTHNCWTTTEEKLTEGLSEDLREAWLRIRETALSFGEQRVYASHKSIMFARKACYFFVRPQAKRLEVCFFLGKPVKNAMIKKVYPSSKVKTAHMVHIGHRDEVERPFTEWLRQAYELPETAKAAPKKTKKAVRKPPALKSRPKRRSLS